MTLRLYNTLTRRKEEFVPREAGKVSMYVCGPTVYNHIHIGNARTFLSFDVIRRYLEYRGFDVRFVQNITDVDDKIIRAANAEGVPAADVAGRYADAFLQAMAALDVEPPTVQPRATETVPDMISMVERLIGKGHAYVVDGDVYFSVRSFPGYGKLSGRDIDEMRSGARVDVDERKKDPLDFALWKSAKPGEPHWPSPWGEGRPGWHLECSVMSEKELGITFDIHGGATDLIFPHHENEIAQSEAVHGETFARYWMHGGLLQVDSEKMSKSLGNFLLLKDVLGDYPAPVIRLLMLQTHYRSPLDFSTGRLDEARAAYDRLVNMVRSAMWVASLPASGDGAPPLEREALVSAIHEARERFEAEMEDDFNSAGALGAVFELARRANVFTAEHQAVFGEKDVHALSDACETVTSLLQAIGVTLPVVGSTRLPAAVIPLAAEIAGYAGDDAEAAIAALLEVRARARAERDWARADSVRDGLAAHRVRIEDTPGGARVTVAED